MSRALKDPLLEKYLAGGLDADARAKVEQTLAGSPEDQARVAELRAESAAFLVQHPAGAFAARFDEAPRAAWWRWWSLAGAVAAAAVTVLLVRGQTVEAPQTQVKGTVALTVHRQTSAGSEVVTPGALLHPQDALRFEVTGTQAGYAAVLGRTAGGAPQALVPAGPDAVALNGGTVLLDGAVALDDAAGPEQFVLVWSETPFRVAEAAAWLTGARPSVVHVAELTFDKSR